MCMRNDWRTLAIRWIDNRLLLVSRFFHRCFHRSQQIRPAVELCRVRNSFNPHPAALQQTDCDPVTAKPGSQFGCKTGCTLFQTLLLQQSRDKFECELES